MAIVLDLMQCHSFHSQGVKWGKNVIIGVNNSSSTHVDNRKKDLGDISKDFTVDNMKKNQG